MTDEVTETGPEGGGDRTGTRDDRPLATVVEGASWVFGGRVVKVVLGFLIQILLARVLGVSSYGVLSLTMTVLGFAGLFAGLGIARGVSRNVSFYEDEPTKSRGVVRAGLTITVVSHSAVAAGLFVFAPTIATGVFGNPDLTLLLRIAAVGLPFAAVRGIGLSVAEGSRDPRAHTVVNQVLGPVANSLLVAGFVLLGFGAAGAVLGSTVAGVLMAVVAAWLALRVYPIDLRGPAESMYRGLLGFSVPLLFSAWMTFFIDETDYFILGIFHSEDLVGTYTAMFTLRPMVLLFFFPATFLLSPVITRLQKQNDMAQAAGAYQAISKWTTLLSLPVFMAGVAFPRVVIAVTFGADYLGGATPLRLLMLSGLVTVLLGANDRVLVGLGHSRTSMYVNGLAAAVNVVLNLLLIPGFGMTGAAVASLTAFATRNVVNSLLLYRWYGLTPFSRALVTVLLAVAVVAPVGYAGFVSLVPVRFVTVAAAGIVFLVVYVPVMIRYGASESIDRELFRQVEESQDVDLEPVKRVLRRLAA